MIKIAACPVCRSEKIATYIKTKVQMHPSNQLFNFDQCANCLLVFLNPRLSPNDLMNYYTDFYLPYRGANAWGRYAPLVEKSQKRLDEQRVKVVEQHHIIKKDTLIVDVGCGKPTFLKQCIQQLNCKALGIDFTDEGWTDSNENFDQLDLQKGEIYDLPENLRAHVFTMWHYLEHDYDPLRTLKALRKRARENATLLIEVPNFESESRKEFGENWAGWHTPRHLSLFSPDNLQLLLQKSGWKTQALYTHGTLDAYLLYWMSKMEQKGINWDKNMETEFVGFVAGMLASIPKKWTEKKRSLGIMLVVAKTQN